MHEQGAPDFYDRRVARCPATQLSRRRPGELVLNPAERMISHPRRANFIIRDIGILCLVELPRAAAIGFKDSVASSRRLIIGKGRILARRGVSIVAEEIHGLVITKQNDDLAASSRGFALKLLQAVYDGE